MSTVSATSGVLHAWPPTLADAFPSDHWLVVHAMPRQEKLLAKLLAAKNLPGCLFLERRVRSYQGKGTQVSLVPLLGGYLFVHAPRERREDIFRTERVCRIIDVSEPIVLATELTALRRVISCTSLPLIVRPELVVGTPVRIRTGTFAGIDGIVSSRKGATELVVNLTLLGHSVAVTLPADVAELVTAD